MNHSLASADKIICRGTFFTSLCQQAAGGCRTWHYPHV